MRRLDASGRRRCSPRGGANLEGIEEIDLRHRVSVSMATGSGGARPQVVGHFPVAKERWRRGNRRSSHTIKKRLLMRTRSYVWTFSLTHELNARSKQLDELVAATDHDRRNPYTGEAKGTSYFLWEKKIKLKKHSWMGLSSRHRNIGNMVH